MKTLHRLSLLQLALLAAPLYAAEQAPETPSPAAAVAEAPTADASAAPDEPLPLPIEEVRIFAQVLNQIRSSYVEPIDDQTLLENAIRGMLAYIDPHSTYLASDDYSALQENTTGEFGGLGVEVGIENGFIKIIAPMDDSPAAR